MQKKFYIFLDIDGVLYDWDYIFAETEAGRMERGEFIKKFKPESMNALNFLIKKLACCYDVKLVISSTWRANLPYAIKTLKNNGLIYSDKIERTPIYDPAKRGEQILDYLSDKTNYEFVIIDDEMFDFKKFFSQEKIIKCEMFHSALDMAKVNNFLHKLNLYTKTDESSK
ncbi:MAG: hypothetical protein E7378_03310 [Clostridiales bacterium]|nr:hypothetical protein [Clostridiales bacterium]